MVKDSKIKKVVIVGAGPSGLLLGILLCKAGIPIILLEKSDVLDANPRAAHYAPSAVVELRRAGVLDTVAERGYHPNGVCWRTIDGKILSGIRADEDDEKDPDAMVCLPLDKLDKVLLEELEKQPNSEVLWEHEVVEIEQDEKEARCIVNTKEGRKVIGGDYIVGCDGANSQIRRCLFGEEYPGETLPAQIIATNVYYPFEKFGYWDSQFIVHPTDWYMAAKITSDGMWRVTYGDVVGLEPEEYIKRQPMRYEQILPGAPKPEDYVLKSASPYKLQQRCAKSFRVGRILLAADAAHLCNPFGGMGLTGGIADISSLTDVLIAMHLGLTDDSILDKYSEVRIKKWREIIDPMSRANFGRLHDESLKADREEFFKGMDRMMAEKDRMKRIGDIRGSTFNNKFTFTLMEDFTPYYKKPAE
ncbi:hypothetical protein B0J14DRAFT_620528 [Halenospora varia]|nr:hypothetical protein B0J14DRAFT_620528 [Halenospora varia]